MENNAQVRTLEHRPNKLNADSASMINVLSNQQVFANMQSLANMMASAGATVPKHLNGNPGDCMAVIMQASQWGMNPYAVAQKTHLVNGTLGYEAQLVAAVINSSGVTTDRFKFEWFGDWEKVIGNFVEKSGNGGKTYLAPNWNMSDEKGLGVRVSATLKGESEPRPLELLLTQATTRNSTLWASDPKQQLAYLAQKKWARLYAPDVILGVYTKDELDDNFNEQPQGSLSPKSSSQTSHADDQREPYPQEDFDNNKATWKEYIQSGKSTPDRIISKLNKKGQVTEVQRKEIESWAVIDAEIMEESA